MYVSSLLINKICEKLHVNMNVVIDIVILVFSETLFQKRVCNQIYFCAGAVETAWQVRVLAEQT